GVYSEKPEKPPTAYFFRRFQSLVDAVRAWGADHSGEPECQRWRSDAAARIKAALGDNRRPDYAAADQAISDWLTLHDPNRIREMVSPGLAYSGLVHFIRNPGESPRRVTVPQYAPEFVVAAELEFIVRDLLVAYSDPERFFREIAPMRFPDDFLPNNQSNLPLVLWTWGLGALLNPGVMAGFRTARGEDLVLALACVEGREPYREGRRKRAQDKLTPPRRSVSNTETKRTVYEQADRIEEATGEAPGAGRGEVEIAGG